MKAPNGIPSAFGRLATRYMLIKNKDEIGNTINDNNNYSPPYESEIISFFIDDSGIVAASWRSPANEINIENYNVETITLDKSKEIFRKQMDFEYSYPINIDKICKLMVRILIKDEKKLYRYVPAYTFYGISQTEYTKKIRNRL